MRLHVVANRHWAAAGADVITKTLQLNPDALIGWPTGHTPLPVYKELRRRAAGNSDFGRMRALQLDDYLGAAELATNFYAWLRRELLIPLKVARRRVLRLPTQPRGIASACARFEKRIHEWGGCDLLLLGLGADGHIGFNEPGSGPKTRTRVVTLAPGTRKVNAAYWHDAYLPTQGVTMGIGTILEARRICLLVRGRAKAKVLRQCLDEAPTTALPASQLKYHKHCTVIADEAAAGA